jgi:hypothetical protein
MITRSSPLRRTTSQSAPAPRDRRARRAACFGGYQLRGHWLERWGNACTAVVLIVIGALVLTGVL